MSQQRYDLGVMDLYPIIANCTQIENNPFLQVRIKENIDLRKLQEAVKKSIKRYPFFGCKIIYDKKYQLETNEEPVILIEAKEVSRPMTFGKNTNGYPWQICYHENTFSLEWCHTITDGRGGFAFFTEIIKQYFDVAEDAPKICTKPGLESFYDKQEKGLGRKKQESGFKASDLPYLKTGYKTTCHILRAPMQEVLSAAKKNDASPAAILPPLFSKTLRKYINPKAKNKNVSCNVVVDCRVPMEFQTMHNCILSKNITYIDRFDTMEFPLVSTIYRSFLDLAVQRENIIAEATEMVDMIGMIVTVKPLVLQKILAKIVAKIMKHSDSNFTFTYLGKLDLPKEVMDEVEDFSFRSWTDMGECNIAAVDVKGTLVMNICENYQNKNIIPDFIAMCKEVGITACETNVFEFEQANYRY